MLIIVIWFFGNTCRTCNILTTLNRQQMTSGEICHCTETWFAKKANERNNCRILYDIANAFDLTTPIVNDSYSYDHNDTTACTTETIHSDVFTQKNGMITVLNKCIDTTVSNNGIMCNMHPSEGVWLFKVCLPISCVVVFDSCSNP
jgi:hypothetical protein